jgi:uncharacterized membrane protein YeaQ/YmgE (transglycosylase-associated protein family)
VWLKTWVPVCRDALMFVAGLAGVIHEELTGQASIPLLVVYTTMLGIPGALGALWLSRTESAPSVSPSQPSEPPG